MKVKLLQYSPISMAIIGARVCYDSFENSDSYFINYIMPSVPSYDLPEKKKTYLKEFPDINTPILCMIYDWSYDEEKIGEKDKELIKRLINSNHHSVLEHIYYTFYISGISRLCLQELVRHRIASYSVQSTRYILKKAIKNIKSKKDVDDYVVYSSNLPIELQRDEAFERLNLIKQLVKEYKNDDLKYLLPENFKTELVMSMNCRELRHFLKLRLDKRAHYEIRELAKKIYEVLPEDHKEILFFDIVGNIKENN